MNLRERFLQIRLPHSEIEALVTTFHATPHGPFLRYGHLKLTSMNGAISF
jgi:hypothetical protein